MRGVLLANRYFLDYHSSGQQRFVRGDEMRYTLKWFDAEQHTVTYSNWGDAERALRRLVKACFEVTVKMSPV